MVQRFLIFDDNLMLNVQGEYHKLVGNDNQVSKYFDHNYYRKLLSLQHPLSHLVRQETDQLYYLDISQIVRNNTSTSIHTWI